MFPKPTPDQTITVYATPRPMRIAVIIDSESEHAVDDFDQIAFYYNNLWGGRYNSIILSRNGQIESAWRRVLELSDADCIYSVVELDAGTADWVNRACCPAVFRNSGPHFRRDSGTLNAFGMVRENPARITTIPSAITSGRSTLFTPQLYYINGNSGENPRSRFIEHNFGKVSNEITTSDAFERSGAISHKLGEDDPLDFFSSLSGHGTNERYTPDRICAYNAFEIPNHDADYRFVFTIVAGDSIEDLALFRTIKMFERESHGRRVVWMPLELLQDVEFLSVLREWIIRSYHTNANHRRGQILSFSENSESLSAAIETLSSQGELTINHAEIDRGTLGLPSPTDDARAGDFFTYRSRQALQCGLVQQKGNLSVQMPDFLSGIHHQEAVMLDLELPYLQNQENGLVLLNQPPEAWRLPRRQGISSVFLPMSPLSRVVRGGLLTRAYARETDLLRIQLPTPELLFHRCISSGYINKNAIAGVSEKRYTIARSSDEGMFLAALVDLFGSPYSCGAVLGNPFWGPLLQKLVRGSDRTSDVRESSIEHSLKLLVEQHGSLVIALDEHRQKTARFLADQLQVSPRYNLGMSWNDMKQEFHKMKAAANSDRADDPTGYWSHAGLAHMEYELDELVADDILRMGVRVRCESCLTDQWIPVDQISSRNACSGCGRENILHAKPDWIYRVNTLAAEAIKQRGVLAVVQALHAAEQGSQCYVALPCMYIYEQSNNQPLTDLDLVYFSNREFVIGEVKASPTGFGEGDLQKLSEAAADIRPDRVVIAAPSGGDWPPAILEQFEVLKELFADRGITWERKELSW